MSTTTAATTATEQPRVVGWPWPTGAVETTTEATPAKKATTTKAAPAKKAPAKKAATTKATPAKKAPAKKATTTKVTPAKKAPAKKAATTKATPAKKTPTKVEAHKPVGLELAELNLAAAKASGAPVHPGYAWRVTMFQKGMTQAQTAEAMGINAMSLNRMFNGHGTPTPAHAIAYAKVMGLDPAAVWAECADYLFAVALASK